MKIYALILGMAFVTYLPRMLPAFLMGRFTLPSWGERWLKSIPYAALAAMIFPGILTINADVKLVGIIGGGIAFLLGFLGMNVIYVISSAIISVMVINQYFL